MNKIQQQAVALTAAIALQGLATPVSAVAGDILAGQSLLPKSASTADCQRRGGGGGHAAGRPAAAPRAAPSGGGGRNVRANASSNVNHNVNANRNANVNRNTNVNRNANVNVNRNVNVNVDNDYRNGWDRHPVATGVAIGATAAVTAAVIGSVVYSVPPSCSMVVVNGISYSQCGSTWYAPRYAGTSVEYVVVNAPG